MAKLRRPTLYKISGNDATKPITFYFESGGKAENITEAQLKITNEDTHEPVYNEKARVSAAGKPYYTITVDANTMVNGAKYSAYVVLFSGVEESPFSNSYDFRCFTQPELSIFSPTDNQIVEENYVAVVIEYTQLEREKLSVFTVNLYNEDKVLIDSSGEVVPTPPNTASWRTIQSFWGLDNNTAYYVRVTGETEYGTKLDSGYSRFEIKYPSTKYPKIIWLKNDCDKGAVEVTCNAGSIPPTVSPSGLKYINGKELDLTNPRAPIIQWNEGFVIDDDFVLRIWYRNPIFSYTENYDNVVLSGHNSSGNLTSEITLATITSGNSFRARIGLTFEGIDYYSITLEDTNYVSGAKYALHFEKKGINYKACLISDATLEIVDEKTITLPPSCEGYVYNQVSVGHAIFDELEITRDLNKYKNMQMLEEWDKNTYFNATFNNTILAGNVGESLIQVKKLEIKKKMAEGWITVAEYAVEHGENLRFTYFDYAVASGDIYTYAIVPVTYGGDYIDYSVDEIFTKFNGVYISDKEKSFRLQYGTNYSSAVANQQTGVFTPLGGKFPIVVTNGVLNYDSGSTTFLAIDDSFEKTGVINRKDVVKYKNELKAFLLSGTPKVLKDWNGNTWLVSIVDNVQLSYSQAFGMGLPQMTFNWVQIGDVNSEKDLINTGFAIRITRGN